MSLQSSAGVPPPPLTGGSADLRTSQVTLATKSKGTLLLPSMTASTADALVPAAGQMVFITTTSGINFTTPDKLYVYTTDWELVTSA